MRTKLIGLLAVVVALLTIGAAPTPASAVVPWTPYNELHAPWIDPNNPRCIDVPGYSTSNGTLLHTWDCLLQTNELWSLGGAIRTSEGFNAYLIKNQHSQKCIRVPRNSTVAGAQLEQYTCQEANRSNLWVPMTTARGGSSRLYKNVNSGLCMGIASAGTANGTRLIQWTCNRSSASQIFYAGA